jgi:hypothetical protein
VKAFVIALPLWSLVPGWFLLFGGSSGLLLDCMHLVGRSVACEAGQESINQASWANHTLPIILGIAAGYIGIVVVRLARIRRRRRAELIG